MKQTDIEENYSLYYWTRYCFWTMIILLILATILMFFGILKDYPSLMSLFNLFLMVSVIATLILSILHLIKIKSKRGFAVTALVLSGMELVLFLGGLIVFGTRLALLMG